MALNLSQTLGYEVPPVPEVCPSASQAVSSLTSKPLKFNAR